MQEMVYLKAIQKSAPMGVSVSGTTDQKTYLKKIRGGFSLLRPPLNPTMLILFFSEVSYPELSQNIPVQQMQTKITPYHV